MRSPDFIVDVILWGFTQPLIEMSIRNLLGAKVRSARNADDLTAICEPIVYNSGIQPGVRKDILRV
jgi:hypothetical protein